MRSRWSDKEAQAAIELYARQQIGFDLALRVYSARLLGSDPALVLHGGGNASVKTSLLDLLSQQVGAVCVKASGWDMAAIEPPGFPALRLSRLRALRVCATLNDENILRLQRESLLDPLAPAPSVETLLHAFLPHAYVDHTHADAVLSLADQPDGEAICTEVYGGRVGIVGYVRPGFALAKRAAEVYEGGPDVEGLILLKHGIFSFGDSAQESYERMIALVSRAEDRLKKGRKAVFASAKLPRAIAPLETVAPLLRGACSVKDERVEGAWHRLLLDFRTSPGILNFINGVGLASSGQVGVVTPDHVLFTKPWPLVVPPPPDKQESEIRCAMRSAVRAFVEGYRAYFTRQNAYAGGGNIMLDPLPRVALVPGLGIFGLGRSKKEARIVADLAASAVATITNAEAIGRFESISESEVFEMEYWPLERAKLGPRHELPLAGQVAIITGAGGAIGAATAHAFASAGAEVALLDADERAAQKVAHTIGGDALALKCDVTDPASVGAAFGAVVAEFGGLDIAVSNAGGAWQGRIGELDEAILRKSFELNFFAHQRVAQAAVRIMTAQGTGGCLLFNVSKQAVNPGPNFGPYGAAKAATLFLVRQYALDHGADGIRANAVNADRVRSGLLTDDFIAERSQARGLTEAEYMRGNLLGREVTPEDVAQAFLHQALQLKTTGDVTTVDGGNIAAALR